MVAPPPYTTDTPSPDPSVLPLPTSANLEGLRSQILDNIPVLWTLAHGGYKPLPHRPYVATVKAHESIPIGTVGKIHAVVMFVVVTGAKGSKGRNELETFVQGPQRDTTEGALRALLEKTETMLGKRWQMPAGRRFGSSYLEH